MAFPKFTLKRALLSLGGVALAVGGALQLSRLYFEEPEFERVSHEGDFELRRYAPRVVAETYVEAASRESATSEGFSRLAGYIFGGNRDIAMTTPVEAAAADEEREGQSISMTTPVEAAPVDGRWRITFTMPSEYRLADLPQPDDERVTLREDSGQLVATVRFSGSSPEAQRVEQLTDELTEWVASTGYEMTSPVTVAQYDPPSAIIPFLRRNELLVDVQAL
ncbi:MAG: heme-binding protein [Polyangiales bacterium]